MSKRLASVAQSMTAAPSPRVVVIGPSCAGKSTFANQLAEARRCARIELDELFWSKNWTPKPQSEFLELIEAASAGQAWVAAGNYSPARRILWTRATTIVWLNYSLPLVFWRGIKRTLRRALFGEVLFHENRESLRRSFLSRESILWWIVSTHRRHRREFDALRASSPFSHVQWLEARHPAAADEILRSLQNAA